MKWSGFGKGAKSTTSPLEDAREVTEFRQSLGGFPIVPTLASGHERLLGPVNADLSSDPNGTLPAGRAGHGISTHGAVFPHDDDSFLLVRIFHHAPATVDVNDFGRCYEAIPPSATQFLTREGYKGAAPGSYPRRPLPTNFQFLAASPYQ